MHQSNFGVYNTHKNYICVPTSYNKVQENYGTMSVLNIKKKLVYTTYSNRLSKMFEMSSIIFAFSFTFIVKKKVYQGKEHGNSGNNKKRTMRHYLNNALVYNLSTCIITKTCK